jgi:16S rRNA (cytidine1402-2'-O)-methyltransferase
MGTLFLVATPIGNLEDITLRALRILREVDLIAAEDTRHTKKLLQRYEIEARLVSYHEHNKVTQSEIVLEALERGDVALVSDAGTPGLSDPGYELITTVIEADHLVSSIPGPSAPIAALVASGLPTDAFMYLGYLPRRSAARKKLLNSLREERQTLLFFEVPHRLIDTLKDLEYSFGPDRDIAVCRELTKIHEEIIRGKLHEIITHFNSVEPRGEFTLVVAGTPKGTRWDESVVKEAILQNAGSGMSPTEIAKKVAAESGWKRRTIYKMILEDR